MESITFIYNGTLKRTSHSLHLCHIYLSQSIIQSARQPSVAPVWTLGSALLPRQIRASKQMELLLQQATDQLLQTQSLHNKTKAQVQPPRTVTHVHTKKLTFLNGHVDSAAINVLFRVMNPGAGMYLQKKIPWSVPGKKNRIPCTYKASRTNQRHLFLRFSFKLMMQWELITANIALLVTEDTACDSTACNSRAGQKSFIPVMHF